MSDQAQPVFTCKETDNAIILSTRLKKHNIQSILAIVLILSLTAAIIFSIVEIIRWLVPDIAAGASTSSPLLFLLYGLVIWGLLLVTRQALNNAFLQEDIEINASSITIVKSGFLMFRNKRVIPAGRIEGIQPTIQLSAQGSLLGDLLMNTSNLGKLSITPRQRLGPVYSICRGITVDETIQILDRIHYRYPQYW
jgi:hypothetical protein